MSDTATPAPTDVLGDHTDDDGFAALGLVQELVDALDALGYEEPTPIQREAIPPLLAGRDLLGQAATGTGKTAAFALPLLQALDPDPDLRDGVAALVLVPTRELAMQVAEAVHRYGKARHVRVLPVYGGASMDQQIRALRRGVDVVIATPGRALDHLRRRTLDLDGLATLVLDEADEMLDMGFEEDLQEILAATPPGHRTALFSATMAPRIRAIAATHLRDPVEIRIAHQPATEGTSPKVRQAAFIVPRPQRMATLGRLLDMEAPTSALIFCRTRNEVDELTETLNSRGYRAEALHGGMTQEQRDRVMGHFRSGATELLVATDVAARGLDIAHLSHVVNFGVPSAPEAYVHRIGRTGRAGREGVALTIAEPREHRLLRNIERLTRQKIELGTVPTVADLRARRLELTRANLYETLVADGDDLDTFRVVVENLAGEFDLMDVAAAAVKLLHRGSAANEEDEQEIRVLAPREGRDREDGPRRGEGRPARRPRRQQDWQATRLFVGAGRNLGVRPGDLVGAIANEARIEARNIGAIEITDRFSLVEVPSDIADDVIRALKGTTIKGQRVTVRRDREAG